MDALIRLGRRAVSGTQVCECDEYFMHFNIIHVAKSMLVSLLLLLVYPNLIKGLHYVSKAMSDPTKRAGAIMSFMSRDKQFWTPFPSEA